MAIDGNDIIVLYRANHIAWEMAITEGRIILIKVTGSNRKLQLYQD
jgi:hypothetical protein